jgi:holo-[acyl-carrier protein] synthase
MKALGTGWGSGVRWVDIETLGQQGQAPELQLHGQAALLARERGIARWHITITHDADLAAAFVIAESKS